MVFTESLQPIHGLLLLGLAALLAAVGYVAWRRWVKPALTKRLSQTGDFPQAVLTPEDTVFPDSRFASVAGFNIRYIQRGSPKKPALVLIHGFSAYIYSWRHILDKLAEDFHVTALDLPGFGKSDKHIDQKYGLDEQTDRIMKFLEHLKIETFDLVGHSMGGAIAAWITKNHPRRVRKLALLSPAVYQNFLWVNPDLWGWTMPLFRKNFVTPALVRRIYGHVTVMKGADLEEVIGHYYSPYSDAKTLGATFKHLHLLRDMRLRKNLAGIENPTLLIYGRKDTVVRHGGVAAFLKDNPQAQVVYDPNAGHMIAEENPAFILENLRRFFLAK